MDGELRKTIKKSRTTYDVPSSLKKNEIEMPHAEVFSANVTMVVPKQSRFCFHRSRLDKIFGIIGHDNYVHRFRVLLEREGTRTNFGEDIRVKVIYLENEVIDCRLNINLSKSNLYLTGTLHKLYENQVLMSNMSFYESPLIRDQYYPVLGTQLTLKFKVTSTINHLSMKRSLALKFNDEPSSNFVLKCGGELFYVHSCILEHHRYNQYFLKKHIFSIFIQIYFIFILVHIFWQQL